MPFPIKSLHVEDEAFTASTPTNDQLLACRLAMGDQKAFGRFRDRVLKDQRFNALEWSDRLLPLTPDEVNEYWSAIWSLIQRKRGADHLQAAYFNRVFTQ
jgi:hypothetical protein